MRVCACLRATCFPFPLLSCLLLLTHLATRVQHFRTVVHTFVSSIRENIEIVLSTLLKGTRRVPEFEVSIMDDVITRLRRPKTAKLARPKTRTELHREIDQFAGIEQEDNSRVLDSLLLESPVHSHAAVGLPKLRPVLFQMPAMLLWGPLPRHRLLPPLRLPEREGSQSLVPGMPLLARERLVAER